MARRRRAAKRELLRIRLYDSKVVAKFINVVMKSGKKSLLKGLFIAHLKISKRLKSTEVLEIFYRLLIILVLRLK